mgnify:CR=1 FL=1
MSRAVLLHLVHCDRPHSPQNTVIYDLLHTAAMSNMLAVSNEMYIPYNNLAFKLKKNYYSEIYIKLIFNLGSFWCKIYLKLIN